MSIALQETNNTKVYNLTSGKSLSQFLYESGKTKKLQQTAEYKNRVEILHDFEFPNSSSRVKISEDSQYILCSGVYPPSIKLFSTSQLSLKHQRNLESEVVQCQFLSSDYRKLVMLCANRSIELHAQYGKHYVTRIPRFGRDMQYNSYNCELFIVGATHEIYRLNLEQGRFMAPLESAVCAEHSVCDMSEQLKWVLSCGGSDGLVELWDLRKQTRASLLDNDSTEITALKFDKKAFYIGVGALDGTMKVYDIRYTRPVFEYKHNNGLCVNSVNFHEGSEYVVSSDPKGFKLYNKRTGVLLTTAETMHNINDIELLPATGVMLVANEGERVGVYYMPDLGPPPAWGTYIDLVTEELEEAVPSTLYTHQQFVTLGELEELNGTELIGTEKVKPYLHGYLLESKAYFKLKALSAPFSYKQYRKERIKQKLEEKTKERIVVKTPHRVNKSFAEDILQGEGKKHKFTKNLLGDERFKELFEDEHFEIDPTSEEFLRLNPSYQPKPPHSSEPRARQKRPRKIIESNTERVIPLKKHANKRSSQEPLQRRPAIPTNQLLRFK